MLAIGKRKEYNEKYEMQDRKDLSSDAAENVVQRWIITDFRGAIYVDTSSL